MEHLYTFIDNLLKEHNKTWEELANFVDVKQELFIPDYFMHNLRIEHLHKIAQFFDCDLSIDFIKEYEKKYHCLTNTEFKIQSNKDLGNYWNDL